MTGKLSIYNAAIMVLLVEISSTETHGNCTCGYYLAYENVGPYCYNWVDEDPPFYFLGGRDKAKKCPGALKMDQENIYMSEDESLCSKNARPQSELWSLSVRQPFKSQRDNRNMSLFTQYTCRNSRKCSSN